MRIGLNWRSVIEGGGPLGVAIAKELDNLIAGVDAWSTVEHNDDGTHADVTAQTVTITPALAGGFALRVVAGLSSLEGAIAFPGMITPDQITADQNNYAPVGWDTSFFMRLSTDTSRNITGITPPAIPAGRLVLVANVGSNDLVLKHESGSSEAEARMVFADSSDITLGANSVILLYRDDVQQRWLGLGGTGGGSGPVTPHNLLSTTHPDTDPFSPPTVSDLIVAQRTLSGSVEADKYWAFAEPYLSLSTPQDPGDQSFWINGAPGNFLPQELSFSDTLWKRFPIGTQGQVLTVDLVSGELVPAWKIGSGGSSSVIGAKAYMSSNATLTYNVLTQVTLSATEFDTSGFWNVTAPTGFTVPVTDIYSVLGQAWFATGFGLRYAYVYVNGVLRAAVEAQLDNVDSSVFTDLSPLQVNAIMSLTAGDFVEFRVRAARTNLAAVTLTGGQYKTWFSIRR